MIREAQKASKASTMHSTMQLRWCLVKRKKRGAKKEERSRNELQKNFRVHGHAGLIIAGVLLVLPALCAERTRRESTRRGDFRRGGIDEAGKLHDEEGEARPTRREVLPRRSRQGEILPTRRFPTRRTGTER